MGSVSVRCVLGLGPPVISAADWVAKSAVRSGFVNTGGPCDRGAAVACMDGKLFDGAYPLLACAGWAAVLVDQRGRTLQVQSAEVDGLRGLSVRRR